ncbi:hypothetical protein BC829DRAFT_101374 [Chytridium lagenaria]|nr:hypothetical protein BC829DRAFT_101374 [Chytridium lagenaria]
MFTDVDDHARRTPVHLASKVSTLAHYLTSPYRDSPLYKIRAIFSWIAQNIAYDVQSFSGWQNGKNISASQNPDHVLKSKMSVCEGYAGLFYALMSAGAPEIECYKVSGAANGAGTEPGDGFMELEGHAWNIVKVCGEYRIIESTWGTGNVSGSKFNRALNPFYFLTRPEQIIPTHFPKVPSFQFLERPLTHFEWMRLPSIREQDFWRYGISLQSVSGHTLDGTGGMMSFLRTNEGRLDLVFKASLDACSVDGEQLAFMAELEFFAEDRPIPNKEVLWVDGYTRRPGITRSQIKVACQYYTLPGPSGTFFGYVNLRFPDVGQGRLLIYITKTKPFQEVFQYNGSPLKFRVENTLPAHMMEPIPERPEAWNVKGAQLIKPYRKYLSVGETVTFIVSAPSGPVNDVYVGHQEHIMRGDAFGSSSGSGGGVEFGWGGIMGRMVGGTRGAMNSSVTYLKEEERGSGLITCTVTIAKSGEWWLVVGLQNSSFTYIAKFQAQ